MTDELIDIILNDIERCKKQTEIEGSQDLFATLVAKYDGLYPGFAKSMTNIDEPFVDGWKDDYRVELNIVREKLEVQLLKEKEKDPLYQFKKTYLKDVNRLGDVVNGSDSEILENEKLKLYKEITAKYYPYVPDFAKGLYQVDAEKGFFEEVTDESLEDNLFQIYYKLKAYQDLGFPGLADSTNINQSPVINVMNKNENRNFNDNQNFIAISFDDARNKIESMTSLTHEDIEDIKSKIDKIEEIIKSNFSRSEKWSLAKDIIKWIADKGVDVGITLLPLLLNI